MKSEDLYSSYVALKEGKARLNKNTYTTAEEALKCPQARGMGGILKPNIIMIDTDDKENTEALMHIIEGEGISTLKLKTDKGFHFYFRFEGENPYRNFSCSKVVTISGLTLDYKIGNGRIYDAIIVDNAEREFIGSCDTLPLLPDFLLKCEEVDKTRLSNLLGLKEGSRHDSLRNSIAPIAKVLSNKEKVRKVVRIINEYILDTPLPQDEIAGFLSDDFLNNCYYCMEEELFVGKTFLHSKLGEILIKQLNIIKVDNKLYCFNGAYYEQDVEVIRRECINHYKQIKDSQRNEVVSYINDSLSNTSLEPSDKYICFNNGLLNTDTWRLEEFTPEVILFNQIPHNYNIKAQSAVVDKALDEWCCDDKELRAILEEYTGYMFIANTKAKSILFIEGDKNNGKSSFIELLYATLGCKNYMVFSIEELDKRFNGAYLHNKLANIGDDIQKGYITNKSISMLKKISSGSAFIGEKKGKEIFNITPYSKFLFSFNICPSLSDETGALTSRIILIPFRNDFSKFSGKRDENFNEKLKQEEACEFMVAVAIKGLKRLIENHYSFSHSSVSEKRKDELFIHSDTIKEFADEYINEENYVKEHDANEVYSQYKMECKRKKYTPATELDFKAYMESIGYIKEARRRDGKSAKFYVRKRRMT